MKMIPQRITMQDVETAAAQMSQRVTRRDVEAAVAWLEAPMEIVMRVDDHVVFVEIDTRDNEPMLAVYCGWTAVLWHRLGMQRMEVYGLDAYEAREEARYGVTTCTGQVYPSEIFRGVCLGLGRRLSTLGSVQLREVK